MDLNYIAGFFDGEGCISIRYQKPRSHVIEVIITNTNRPVLELIQNEIGGTIITKKRYKSHWRISYQLKLSARKAVAFLSIIESFLILKQKQARLALSLNELNISRRVDRWHPLTDEEFNQREFYRQSIMNLQRRPTPNGN